MCPDVRDFTPPLGRTLGASTHLEDVWLSCFSTDVEVKRCRSDAMAKCQAET